MSVAALLTATLFFGVDAHSWMWYLQGDVDDGLARMGYIGLDDDYYTRYVCPLASLDDCALAPRHNIVLTESNMRPCRVPGSPGAPNINDLAVVNAGKKLRIEWRNNGHAHNGESEGSCVSIRITPYKADPDWADFEVVETCMPYYHDNFDTSGEITIPESYAAGKYTISWMWEFGPFYFGACADVLVENTNSVETDPPATTEATVSADASPTTTPPPPPPPAAATTTPTPARKTPKTATSGGGKTLYEQYQDHGCTGLDNPGKFCFDYFGTYCKSTAGVDECGRSICHRSSYDDLLPCKRRSLRASN